MIVQLLKYTKRLAKQQKTGKTVSEAGDGGKGIKTIRHKQIKQMKLQSNNNPSHNWLGAFKLEHPHPGH